MWGPYSPALQHSKKKVLHENSRCLVGKKTKTEEMSSHKVLQLSHQQQLSNNHLLQHRFTEAKRAKQFKTEVV